MKSTKGGQAGEAPRQDVEGAIRSLETKKAQGSATRGDIFRLLYLYCLSGNVEKAEAIAAADHGSIQKDSYVTCLWGKLHHEFGFRPPS